MVPYDMITHARGVYGLSRSMHAYLRRHVHTTQAACDGQRAKALGRTTV